MLSLALRTNGLNHTWAVANNFFFCKWFSLRGPFSYLRYPSRSTSFSYIYIIYINDLPANCLLNSVPQMYADDTHLTFASNNILNINTVKMKTLRELKNWLLNYQQDYS